MEPRAAQAENGSDELVAASTVRLAPGMFVSVIWMAPLVVLAQAANRMGLTAH